MTPSRLLELVRTATVIRILETTFPKRIRESIQGTKRYPYVVFVL